MEILQLLIVAALLFALITALIASNKGRNGLGWFFLGLLFGPIGLIWVLMVSSSKKIVEDITID